MFINLAKAKGGTVILNEEELDDAGKSVEKRVKLVTQTDTDELGNETTRTLINVYDKDDVLIDSEDAADNANIYVCEVKTDEVVTVKVVADDGYVISKYDLQDRLVDGVKIDVGFDKTEGDDLTVAEGEDESSASDKTEFSYPVFMKDNMALTIELEEKQEETTDDTEKAGSADDVTDDTAKDKEAVDDTDAAKDTDLTVDGEVASDDSKKDMNTDLTVDGEKKDEEAKDHEASGSDVGSTETESSETSEDTSGNTDNTNTAEDGGEVTENVADDNTDEDVNADESGSIDKESSGESVEDVNSDEAENIDTVDMTGETHFIDTAENIGDLDSTSFSTARLIILSDDSNAIIDPEHIIGNYDNIYLMQYKSVEQAMNAYAYYEVNADAVKPDVAIMAADETDVTTPVDEITGFAITEDENPISAIESESKPETRKIQEKTIALIDTGVSESHNIIDRVSMIDDNLSSLNNHGDKMVKAITSQNADASIIAIKALGDDGKGTVSSIVAGMEYAINQNVDIINLSLYTKANIFSSVLQSEIIKAEALGINVVGAAGNSGSNAINYIPGAVNEAWIIGACADTGERLAISNYGNTVDYNVIASSTSEAAAKFTGYISKNGIDNIDVNNGLIYSTSFSDAFYEENDTYTDTIKLYYLFYKGEDENSYTKGVKAYMNVRCKYNIKDGFIVSQINPNPEKYDYNEGESLDVDINRGGYAGLQIPITEECDYNEETGYIKIPAQYKDESITVSIWQSCDSAFYKQFVPDEMKLEDDRNGLVTVADFINDFTGGEIPSGWEPKGCNVIELESSSILNNVSKGSKYTINEADTKYISPEKDKGNGEVQWSWLPGADEYDDFDFGQIIHIAKCKDNPNFENIGTLGSKGKGSRGWVFTNCISDISNNFYGAPVFTGGYIECISINKAKTSATFYIHCTFESPDGTKLAQTMAGFFKVTAPATGKLQFTKYIDNADNFSESTSRINMNTQFTVWSSYNKTTKTFSDKVKTVKCNAKDVTSTARVVTIDGLAPGTYYLNESKRCVGTIDKTKKAYSFVIKKGKTTTKLTVVDTGEEVEDITNETFYFEGEMFSKLGKSTKGPVADAIFRVEYSAVEDDEKTTDVDEFKSNKFHRTWYFKSGADGKVSYDTNHYLSTWTNPANGKIFTSDAMFSGTNENGNFVYMIPLGELRVQELYVDSAFKKDSTIYKFAPEANPTPENGVNKWYDRKMHLDYYNWVEPAVIYNEENYSKIKIKKTNQNGAWNQSLAGASFQLIENNNVLETMTINDGEYHTFSYNCIPNHTYSIHESVTPNGYTASNDISVAVGSGVSYKKEYEYSIKNTEKPSRVNITKTSSSGWNDKLKEAQFSLYELNAATHAETWLNTIQIESQNAKEFPVDIWAEHTYVIRETKTPTGYITAAPITFTVNALGNYQAQYSYTVTNVEAPKVQITKKSDAPQDILDLSAYTVSGAEFGVYEDQACTRKVPNGTLTTKENGVTDTLTLPCSADGTYTYWVREDKAPNGHKKNKTPQAITVTLPADAGVTKPMTFTNEPETDELSAFAQKLDNKGQPVKDAVFKVRLYDGEYTTVQECEAKGVLKKTWYLKSTGEQGLVEFKDDNIADDINNSYRSDNFYTWKNKIVIPIGCTVTYQEVQTPSEYILDDTTQIWSKKNQQIVIKKYYNWLKPCKITIQKLSDDGKTPLRGVHFELTFVKQSETYTQDAIKTYTPLLKEGESVTGITDANGYVVWDNLDQGEYKIVETKTLSGMSLLKDPINITLPITMTDKQAKDMSAATDQGRFDEGYTNKWYFYEAKFEVTNTPNFVMPTTGANGIWKFIFFGFGTMAILGTGLIVFDSKNKKTKKHKKRK